MNWLKISFKIVAVIFLSFVFFLLLLFRNDIPKDEIVAKYSLPESHFIEVDGINLHVRFLGEGIPVFLIHVVVFLPYIHGINGSKSSVPIS